MENDPVNHPKHYTSHPSGVECIQITEHMSFNLGNAVKYLWRSDLKGNAIEDLEKAEFYIKRELAKRRAASFHTHEIGDIRGMDTYRVPSKIMSLGNQCCHTKKPSIPT